MSNDQIAERFKRETATHELTVLHDDGLYRHLSFAKPGTSLYRFDLVTWPGHLTLSGDLDGYTFKYADDMFDFFRRSTYNGDPNHTYWDEKVAAGRASVMTYSEELFNRLVAERLEAAEAKWPGITADWREKTTDFFAEYDLSFDETARYALRDYAYLPEGATGEPFAFDQDLLWNTSFKDYDWSFLWCCHAIVHGIAQYDKARKAEPAPRQCSFAERQVCALWLQEHGDYADWSPETHAAYEKTIHAMAVAS